MIYYFFTSALKNCQEHENHLKMFKLKVGFGHAEFLKNSRAVASMYHPDNTKTGDSEKFLIYSELRDILDDPKNSSIVKLYNEFGPVVDLLSIRRTDLTQDVIDNIGIMEGIKHVVMAMILGLVTILFFWDSADRGIIQYCLIVVFFI